MTATPTKHIAKNGAITYKVRFRLGLNKAGTGKRQQSETFTTKRAADEFAGLLDVLGPQGALDRLYADEQPATMPTLDEVAHDHVRYMTGVTPGYRLTSQRLWARTWGPIIGSMRADLVTKDAIAEALNALALHYSPKSLKNQRGLLFGVLERCIEQGYLTTNPARKLRLPEGRFRGLEHAHDDDDDDDDKMFLTLAEFGILYMSVAERYRPLVRFLAGTGCRWGETVALRVRDVQLTGVPAVRIRRAVKWSPDGKFTIGPPKTKKSRRTVTVGPEVADDLAELVKGKAPNDYVFTAARGGIIQHRTFWSDQWRPALWRAQRCPDHTDPACKCGTAHPKRCKVHEVPPPPCGCAGTLGKTPRIHDLRHTHASWLLEKYPITVVQARLGHESIQTTVDTYGHLRPDVMVAAASVANLDFGHELTHESQRGRQGDDTRPALPAGTGDAESTLDEMDD